LEITRLLKAAIIRLIFWLSLPSKNVFLPQKRISSKKRTIPLSAGAAVAAPGYFLLKTRQP